MCFHTPSHTARNFFLCSTGATRGTCQSLMGSSTRCQRTSATKVSWQPWVSRWRIHTCVQTIWGFSLRRAPLLRASDLPVYSVPKGSPSFSGMCLGIEASSHCSIGIEKNDIGHVVAYHAPTISLMRFFVHSGSSRICRAVRSNSSHQYSGKPGPSRVSSVVFAFMLARTVVVSGARSSVAVPRSCPVRSLVVIVLLTN